MAWYSWHLMPSWVIDHDLNGFSIMIAAQKQSHHAWIRCRLCGLLLALSPETRRMYACGGYSHLQNTCEILYFKKKDNITDPSSERKRHYTMQYTKFLMHSNYKLFAICHSSWRIFIISWQLPLFVFLTGGGSVLLRINKLCPIN